MCLLSHHRAGGWRSRSDTPLPAAAHGAGRPKHTASAGAAPASLPLPALRLPPQQGTCSEPSSVLTCGVQDLGGWGKGTLGARRCWGVSAESLAPRSVGVRIRWVHLASGYLRCQLLTLLQKAARVTGRRSLKPIGSSSLILFSSSPRPHPDRSTAVPWGPSGQTRLCHPFSHSVPWRCLKILTTALFRLVAMTVAKPERVLV